MIAHRGDMLFTHFGVSGPIALRCSQFIRQVQRKFDIVNVDMGIDMFPDRSQAELEAELKWRLEDEPRKSIKNVLKGMLPERMIPLLLSKSSIDSDMICSGISKTALTTFASILKSSRSALRAPVR